MLDNHFKNGIVCSFIKTLQTSENILQSYGQTNIYIVNSTLPQNKVIKSGFNLITLSWIIDKPHLLLYPEYPLLKTSTFLPKWWAKEATQPVLKTTHIFFTQLLFFPTVNVIQCYIYLPYLDHFRVAWVNLQTPQLVFSGSRSMLSANKKTKNIQHSRDPRKRPKRTREGISPLFQVKLGVTISACCSWDVKYRLN